MKFLSILLFTLCSFSALGDELKSQFAEIDSLIDEAVKCVPRHTDKGYQFCTGMLLTSELQKEIANLTLGQCYSKIKSHGIEVITKRPKAPSSSYIQFEQSTKRAYVLHDKKQAYFKSDARIIDCVHELLHVFQREQGTGNALNPLVRSVKTQKLKKLLSDKVDIVESYEREGKIKEAKAVAAKLSPYIALLGKWEDLINWLDEKEIYYYIYSNCDDLSCSLDDREIALSNLVRFKSRFPWRISNSFINEARKIVLAREQEAFEEINSFRPLDNDGLIRLKKMWGLPEEKLISALGKERIVSFRSPIKKSFSGGTINGLPKDSLSKLKFVDLKNSLFVENFDTKGFDGTSLICNPKKSLIILTEASSSLTLIREYIRSLLSTQNPKICSLVKDRRLLNSQFKSGKIERGKFEKELLSLRALGRKVDLEIYQTMLKFIDLSDDEKTSVMTSLFFKSFASPKRLNPSINPISLSFSEENSLPSIKVEGESYVLDTGAMDSVARPSKLLPVHFDKLTKLKNLNFRLANGSRVDAPKVMLSFPYAIGEGKFSHTSWGVADLKIPGVNGIVGMDFLSRGDFVLDLKGNRLVFTVLGEAPSSALPLVYEHDGRIRTLEFICPDDNHIRLDSGSQVQGDLSYKIGKDNFTVLEKGEAYSCGPLSIKGSFESSTAGGVLFDRGVVLNLGWPWMKQFSKINVSISNGWIEFVK